MKKKEKGKPFIELDTTVLEKRFNAFLYNIRICIYKKEYEIAFQS
jgi:hypothetical protein